MEEGTKAKTINPCEWPFKVNIAIKLASNTHAELVKRVLSVDKELQRSPCLLERIITAEEDTLQM